MGLTAMERAEATIREAVNVERAALRPEEVALALGISRAKVYDLISTGDIPSFKLGGNRRVAPVDLTAYVDRLRSSANGIS